MSQLKNDSLLRALQHKDVPYTPIWIMRQAGRYLPEYRQVRAEAKDFLTLCKTPELACQVTLQPLDRFALDAAIIFSDILTIPDAMGLGLHFVEGEGPQFERPIRCKADIEKLRIPDPMIDLRYVCDAIQMTRVALDGKVPLIGFAGSPWTLACYMVEGGSSKQFRQIKAMMFQAPETLHYLLGILADATTAYLNAQIQSGAQALMIFDTWGGILSAEAYQEFSLNYMTHIISGLVREREGQTVPVILFTKNGGQWISRICDSGCDAIGLDWTTELSQVRTQVGNKFALQGNLDPAVLYANPEQIRAEVKRVLASYGHGSGHVFNLGHGILPDVPLENVAILVDAVHELSREYHQ